MSIGRVAIIGAGIAGLSAARRLVEKNLDVVIFERSHKPGGRCATRVIGETTFDHGAQYFTARTSGFQGLVNSLLEDGVIAPWKPRLVAIDANHRWIPKDNGPVRYVAVGGMRSLPETLAHDLDLRLSTDVQRIVRKGRELSVLPSGGGDGESFDLVILALPPSQAIAVLDAFPAMKIKLEHQKFQTSWALMAGFGEPLAVEIDAAFINDGPLRWIARDSSKPGRGGEFDTWVVHATDAWSAGRWSSPRAEIADSILELFFHCLRLVPTQPEINVAHRWGASQAVDPLNDGFVAADHQSLLVCGDWCQGSKIEGAFVSGLEAANEALRRLSS